MRESELEDENSVSIVEVCRNLVKHLSQEEFRMLRFCLGVNVGSAHLVEEHPAILAIRSFIEGYRDTLKKLFVFFKTHKQNELDENELDEMAHECLTFIKENFDFSQDGKLKPKVIFEIMLDSGLLNSAHLTQTNSPSQVGTYWSKPVSSAFDLTL